MSVIDAVIAKKLCGGGGSVPKPLTYDYMPEGYPTKSGWSIEWDGNTNGLVSIANEFYKVSDMVPTDNELIGATIETSAGESFKLDSAYITAVTEDITMIGEGFALIVRKDNAPFNNGTIPQKGTYFTVARDFYTARLSNQTITPMAEEFLPNSSVQFIVNVWATNRQQTVFKCDKTISEIQAAIESKTPITLRYRDSVTNESDSVIYNLSQSSTANNECEFQHIELNTTGIRLRTFYIRLENGNVLISRTSNNIVIFEGTTA